MDGPGHESDDETNSAQQAPLPPHSSVNAPETHAANAAADERESSSRRAERKVAHRRQLPVQDKNQRREAGWDLSPMHQFEKPLHVPGMSQCVTLDELLSSPPSRKKPTAGQSSPRTPKGDTHTTSLPPIPSSPRAAILSRTGGTELREAKILATMWVRERDETSASGNATGASLNESIPHFTASAGASSFVAASPSSSRESAAGQVRRNSLTPVKETFAVPGVSPNGGLFEAKSGYPTIPRYQERIHMHGKLGTAPFRLHSPSSSPSRPTTRGAVTGSRRSNRSGVHQ